MGVAEVTEVYEDGPAARSVSSDGIAGERWGVWTGPSVGQCGLANVEIRDVEEETSNGERVLC